MISNFISKLQIYNRLKEMKGVTVYKKDDIPDNFHIKKATFTHDIVIMAELSKL